MKFDIDAFKNQTTLKDELENQIDKVKDAIKDIAVTYALEFLEQSYDESLSIECPEVKNEFPEITKKHLMHLSYYSLPRIRTTKDKDSYLVIPIDDYRYGDFDLEIPLYLTKNEYFRKFIDKRKQEDKERIEKLQAEKIAQFKKLGKELEEIGIDLNL